MRDRRTQTECALCGKTLVGISPVSKVQKVLIGASGRENMRVVLVDGNEIHRCPALRRPTGTTAEAL